jgi:uncharacterized protein YdeI (YjbR/CyaY-like superfamily)
MSCEFEYEPDRPAVYAPGPACWRKWLEENHATEKSIWLIIYRKGHSKALLNYDAAVNEALCFGWIDSKPNKRDSDSFYQYFARRNPKSNWSAVNKLKVEKLLAEGKMAPAGLEMVELAKKTGTWIALDRVENLELPTEMAILLSNDNLANTNWQAFPKSIKKGLLEGIWAAKTPETQSRRIAEAVDRARRNDKVLFRPKGNNSSQQDSDLATGGKGG